MRVVIDTNVIVSGLYDPDSIPGRILDAGFAGRLELCAPVSVRDELRRVLVRVLGMSPPQVDFAIRFMRIEWVPLGVFASKLEEARALLRDADDAPILALALAVGCDIISGDKDLHAVKVRGLRVWRPSEISGR